MTSPAVGGRLPLARILLAIGGVYVAQSLVGGLTFMGVPAALRSQGMPIEQIGAVSLLMLPWALKFLWAPYVERYRIRRAGGRRSRNLVRAGQLLSALALGALAFAGPEGGSLMFAALAFVALSAATVDIATDAFAVEQLSAAQRGWGNTAQVAGGYLGMVLGGGVFLTLLPVLGWTGAVLSMAACVLVLSLPFAFGPEPAPVGSAGEGHHRPTLRYALARREVQIGLLITVLFEAGVRLVQVLSGPFLLDRGLDLTLLGVLNGAGAVGAGLAGTGLGGYLVKRWGARTSVLVAAGAQAATLLSIAVATLSGADVILLAGLVVVKSLVMAMGFVALYSLLMGLSSLKQAGVDFTLFQCADAAVAGLAGTGAGFLAAHSGYGASFAFAAALAFAGLLLLPRLLNGAFAVAEPRA